MSAKKSRFSVSSFVYVLHFVIAFVCLSTILLAADQIFGFNIFSREWEQVMGFLIISAIIIGLSLLAISFVSALVGITDFTACYTRLHAESMSKSIESRTVLNRRYFLGFVGALILCFAGIKGISLYDLGQKDDRLRGFVQSLYTDQSIANVVIGLEKFDFAIGEDISGSVTDKIEKKLSLNDEEKVLEERLNISQLASRDVGAYLAEIKEIASKQYELSIYNVKLVHRIGEKKYRNIAREESYGYRDYYRKSSFTKEERYVADTLENLDTIDLRADAVVDLMREDSEHRTRELAIPLQKVEGNVLYLLLEMRESQ